MDHFLDSGLLTGSLLFFLRIAVALRLTPFLGGRPLPVIVCLGIAMALCLVGLPVATVSLPAGVTLSDFIVLAMRECVIGASFGLLAMLVFSVLEMIGGLAGLAALSVPDAYNSETMGGSPFRSLYVFFGIGAFVLVDGHHALFSAIVGSSRCVPVGDFDSGGQVGVLLDLATGLFAGAFAWAVMVVAPIFAAGLFAEVFSALAIRMIPSLDQTAGSQPLRLIAVHLVLVAALAVSVGAAVAFLRNGISELPVCGV